MPVIIIPVLLVLSILTLLLQMRAKQAYFENIANDSAGFLYFNPNEFHKSFALNVDPGEADILAIVQNI